MHASTAILNMNHQANWQQRHSYDAQSSRACYAAFVPAFCHEQKHSAGICRVHNEAAQNPYVSIAAPNEARQARTLTVTTCTNHRNDRAELTWAWEHWRCPHNLRLSWCTGLIVCNCCVSYCCICSIVLWCHQSCVVTYLPARYQDTPRSICWFCLLLYAWFRLENLLQGFDSGTTASACETCSSDQNSCQSDSALAWTS